MENLILAYMGIIETNKLPSETLDKGDFIFKQGDPINAVFFVAEGTIFVMKENLVLWSVGMNQIVGISSFMSTTTEYSFSAKASSNTKIYRIPLDIMNKELRENQVFSQLMIKELCKRIDHINEKTRRFLDASSRNRLIDLIIEQAKLSNNSYIPFKINELSELVGVSARLARSMIKELEDKKLIRFFKDRMEIIDLKGLEIINRLN